MLHIGVALAVGEDLQGDFKGASQIGNGPFRYLVCKWQRGNSVDLNHRSRVDASSPEVIVAHAEYHHHRSDKGGVVHVVSRDWQLRWPHAEKDEDDLVDAGKNVDRYTVHPWYVPRSKYQFGIIRFVTGKARVMRQDAASTASVEQKARGD